MQAGETHKGVPPWVWIVVIFLGPVVGALPTYECITKSTTEDWSRIPWVPIVYLHQRL
jgi:hypothetical protein